MAPVVAREAGGLVKRYCDYYDSRGVCHYSSWGWWGRWVLAGAIVLVFLLVLLMLARKNSRARRARGQRPFYGTGFLAGPAPPYTPYPQGGSSHVQGGPPPPQYVYPDNTGNKFNSNEGYYGAQQGNSSSNNNYGNYNASSPYGGQQTGIELQQPASTYQRGGVDEYAPPEGPPPNKRT